MQAMHCGSPRVLRLIIFSPYLLLEGIYYPYSSLNCPRSCQISQWYRFCNKNWLHEAILQSQVENQIPRSSLIVERQNWILFDWNQQCFIWETNQQPDKEAKYSLVCAMFFSYTYNIFFAVLVSLLQFFFYLWHFLFDRQNKRVTQPNANYTNIDNCFDFWEYMWKKALLAIYLSYHMESEYKNK